MLAVIFLAASPQHGVGLVVHREVFGRLLESYCRFLVVVAVRGNRYCDLSLWSGHRDELLTLRVMQERVPGVLVCSNVLTAVPGRNVVEAGSFMGGVQLPVVSQVRSRLLQLHVHLGDEGFVDRIFQFVDGGPLLDVDLQGHLDQLPAEGSHPLRIEAHFFLLFDFGEKLLNAQTLIDGLACQHFIKDHPQCPHVALLTVTVFGVRLRGHIGGRSHIVLDGRFLAHDHLAVAKVNNGRLALRAYEDIGGLEVPVDKQALYNGCISDNNFSEDFDGFGWRETAYIRSCVPFWEMRSRRVPWEHCSMTI